MARRITEADRELRAQIKALEAAVKADKAEQRATEAPIREARRRLSDSLNGLRSKVLKWTGKVAQTLEAVARGDPSGYRLTEYEGYLKGATAKFQARLTELQLFDLAHSVVADYLALPAVDREAIVRETLAERRQQFPLTYSMGLASRLAELRRMGIFVND